MKVWMRRFSACFTASPARSMSLLEARARPQTVAFFTRLAISETASKSPLEAIGKPASITSTPISSRTSATCSFSSSVMEAPGLCSPSRSVVSKMTMRSLGADTGAFMDVVLVEPWRPERPDLAAASTGVNGNDTWDEPSDPLSARP